MTSYRLFLIPLGAGLLVASTISSVPASTAPGRAPHSGHHQVVKDGHDHLPTSVQTTVPAGGSSQITTPTLGKDVDTLKVTIKPVGNPTAEEDAVYDQFLSTIGNLSKGKRLLVCVMMYQTIAHPHVFPDDPGTFDAGAFTAAGAVLLACLQMAGLLQSDTPARPGPAAARAGTGCGQVRPSLPAELTHTADGYTLHAEGILKTAKKLKYRVACRAKGNTFTYTIRPAKKGVPLRRVLGKKISVGIQSPPGASTSVPVKVTFAAP